MNSGGGINTNMLFPKSEGDLCISSLPKSVNCELCRKPYLCKLARPPAGKTPQLGANTFVEEDAINTYIGENGELWNDVFLKNPYAAGEVSVTQCKFLPEDWDTWISVLKNFYKNLLTRLNPDGSTNDKGLIIDPAANIPYLENEVNFYINPDKTSKRAQALNKTFLESIVGVFYISNNCVDQIDSPVSKNICASFYGDLSVEQSDKATSFYKAFQLLELLKAQGIDGVSLYAAKLDSNAYPSYKRLKQLEAGVVEFSELFQKINI